MPRKKRPIEPEEQETAEAILGLIADEGDVEVPPEPVEEPQSPPVVLHSTVDDYLRKKILIDIYGTDTPTDRDLTLQALKDRL